MRRGFDPAQPYPSERVPVSADNVVASSQPLAVQAGLEALRRGGNAVDAALATAITLTIVEPTGNGIGSDAFAILWDGERLEGLNASGRAPAAWTRERFAGQDAMPRLGWDAVTVPGAVSAWVALSERYGALPFGDLFEAGIRYATDGFHVGPKTARHWAEDAPMFEAFPDFRAHFLPAPAPGTRFRRPDAAATLAEIARTGGESFYRGALARRMASAAAADGGALTEADLAAHTADWVTPIDQDYAGYTLHEIPPNGQGLAALLALGMLAHHDLGPADGAAGVHRQVEAMKIALHAAATHLADANAMEVGVEALLDPDSLARAAAGIGETAAPLPPRPLPAGPDTVYLAAADAHGRMVSFIQSNYWGFGSGIVVPGTGISLQNRGCGFSLDPAHPNCVAPGKRPFHTIIPGFLSEAGAPRMCLGVMGGPMQAQGHVQLVIRACVHGQNPQAASDAPRWHVYADYSVGLEPGFPTDVAADLERRGHTVRYDDSPRTFGGAQLVLRTDDGYVAGSDHRKEGCAAGF